MIKNSSGLRIFRNLNQEIYIHGCCFKQQRRLTYLHQKNVDSNTNGLKSKLSAKVKSFKDIPTLSTWQLLCKHLPGGEYANYDSVELLMAMKKELGPIYKMHGYFGRPDSIITHNPDDFEKVLRSEGKWPYRPTFGGMRYHRNVLRSDFFQGVEGLVATQGQQWASFHAVVQPILLKPQNVSMYINKMSKVNQQFIERILEIRDPRTFQVPDTFHDELNRWSLESIAIVALDKQMGFITTKRMDPNFMNIFNNVREFFTASVDVTFKPGIWKLFRKKSFQRLMQCQDGFVETSKHYVEKALKRIAVEKKQGGVEKPEHEKSVLEKLIAIDKKIAMVMAMDMLVAGIDTTSSAMAGLLLCLATNPEKQAILRQEIRQALPHKRSIFDEKSCKKLPYLRACRKEALRLYPIFWGAARRPVNDVILSGYHVPKGTPVSVITTSLLKNDNVYPRAKEFLPERWLRSTKQTNEKTSSVCPINGKSNNPFIYLPFGYGARQCIGRRLAEQELDLAAAYLIRNFYIEFNYSTENAFKPVFIQVPNIPFKFKFTDVSD